MHTNVSWSPWLTPPYSAVNCQFNGCFHSQGSIPVLYDSTYTQLPISGFCYSIK